MPQDKRGNNGDDGNVLVKVTVRRGKEGISWISLN